jgi:predicted Zn-dependent protease
VKEYAAARKTLEPLDATTSEAPQLQYAYAVSLMETGDATSGVTRLLTLEKSDPDVGEVHRALGEAYATQKSPGAADELETAIRLDPTDAQAHVDLARLRLAQGNTKAAVTHLEAALKLEPGNIALQKELADISHPTNQH